MEIVRKIKAQGMHDTGILLDGFRTAHMYHTYDSWHAVSLFYSLATGVVHVDARAKCVLKTYSWTVLSPA